MLRFHGGLRVVVHIITLNSKLGCYNRQLSLDPEVQSIVEELVQIKRGKPRLTHQESEEARKRFIRLRKLGYTAKQMEIMTGGVWKEAAIKAYIDGVAPEPDSTGPLADLETVGQLAAAGVDSQNAGELIAAKKILDDNSVSIQQAAQLVRDVIGAGMSVQALVATVSLVRASGIPIEQLGRINTYRESLGELGIDSVMLSKLVDIIKKQGDLDKTIELVYAVGQSESWQADIQKIKKTKEDAQESLATLQEEIRKAEDRKKTIQAELDLYHQLEDKGFTQELLGNILESAKKYGDPNKTLEALNRFDFLVDGAQLEKELDLQLQKVQADLKKLQADYQSYGNVIKMLEYLMQKGFSVSLLERIYDAAKQYDEPIEVLKAIERFGKLPETERALAEAKLKITETEERFKDYDEIKRQRNELLKNSAGSYDNATKIIQELSQELEKPPTLRNYRKELIDSGLPERMEGIIERELAKRIVAAQDKELLATFQNEMTRQANAYLNSGRRFSKQFEDKLKQKTLENPIAALRGRWDIPCIFCGEHLDHSLTLDSYSIQWLLLGRSLDAEPSIFAGTKAREHRAHVKLADIVKLYLEHEPRRE